MISKTESEFFSSSHLENLLCEHPWEDCSISKNYTITKAFASGSQVLVSGVTIYLGFIVYMNNHFPSQIKIN